jgi:hypothetical protein
MIGTAVAYLSYKISYEKYKESEEDDHLIFWSILTGITFPLSLPVFLTLYLTQFLYNKFKTKNK